MRRVFAPGCALLLYKPHLAGKIHALFGQHLGPMDPHLTCCKHEPRMPARTEVINICPGCDKRFRNDYASTTTVSLWEILDAGDFFAYPDYHGAVMSITDACPTRDQPRVHDAVRGLLQKMNISLVEPRNTRTNSACCGDSLWGQAPVEKIKAQMARRAAEMPAQEVVVYCVSCAEAMYIGGRRPRYLVDLLFNEQTAPRTLEPEQWHRQLDEYIEGH